MKYLKIQYRLLVYHTSFYCFSGYINKKKEKEIIIIKIKIIIKKRKRIKLKMKKKKKGSENDQLTGHFQSFFIYIFSSSPPPPAPDPKSEKKNPVNQLIKKFWPYQRRGTRQGDRTEVDSVIDWLNTMWLRLHTSLFHTSKVQW